MEERKIRKSQKSKNIGGSIISWEEKLTEPKEVILNRYVRKQRTFRRKADIILCFRRHNIGVRINRTIRAFGIEDNQGNIVTEHRWALRLWENFLENCPNDIAIEAEDELNEDDKGPTIIKSEMVKAIKYMWIKKPTRGDNILVDLLKQLRDSGLKIMTVLVNTVESD